MVFDTDDPPTSYKQFQKQIRQTIEQAEIHYSEDFDTAIFYVDSNGRGGIVYAFEVYQQENENIDPDTILYSSLPTILKEKNARFYALVLPAEDAETEVIMLLTGDINETHLLQAEMDRDDGQFIELEPWERLNVMNFPEITVPFRRAITYQG